MDCKETLELLQACGDQELGLPEAIEIDKHVQSCPACREEMSGQKALRTAVRRHATYLRRASPPTERGLRRRIAAFLPRLAADECAN
jgi:anti-sigma factor RsiW